MHNNCYPKRNPTDLTFFLLSKGRLRIFTTQDQKRKLGFMSLAVSNIHNSTDKFCTSLS